MFVLSNCSTVTSLKIFNCNLIHHAIFINVARKSSLLQFLFDRTWDPTIYSFMICPLYFSFRTHYAVLRDSADFCIASTVFHLVVSRIISHLILLLPCRLGLFSINFMCFKVVCMISVCNENIQFPQNQVCQALDRFLKEYYISMMIHCVQCVS